MSYNNYKYKIKYDNKNNNKSNNKIVLKNEKHTIKG